MSEWSLQRLLSEVRRSRREASCSRMGTAPGIRVAAVGAANRSWAWRISIVRFMLCQGRTQDSR